MARLRELLADLRDDLPEGMEEQLREAVLAAPHGRSGNLGSPATRFAPPPATPDGDGAFVGIAARGRAGRRAVAPLVGGGGAVAPGSGRPTRRAASLEPQPSGTTTAAARGSTPRKDGEPAAPPVRLPGGTVAGGGSVSSASSFARGSVYGGAAATGTRPGALTHRYFEEQVCAERRRSVDAHAPTRDALALEEAAYPAAALAAALAAQAGPALASDAALLGARFARHTASSSTRIRASGRAAMHSAPSFAGLAAVTSAAAAVAGTPRV